MQKVLSQSAQVHHILSRSYSVYLFSVIVGLILDTIYTVNFSNYIYSNVGFIFMCIGTIFVYWSQSTSSKSKKKSESLNITRNFACGPYKYSRNPTHIGLMFLALGFGFIIGSFFVIILTVFAFITTKFVFLPKEEELLEKKYGDTYRAYKKKVCTWI